MTPYFYLKQIPDIRVELFHAPESRLTMTKSLILPAILLALLVPEAQAQKCNLSQTKGIFSALATGSISVFPPPLGILAGPTTRVGRVDNDGKGNVHLSAVTSLNGFVLAEEYDGVLVVNPDCSTEVNFLIPFPLIGFLPFQFVGATSDNFRQQDIILASIGGGPPASTVTITLRQQPRSNCSNGDLKGVYVVNMRGTTELFSGSPKPFVRLGQVTFDGVGAFSANTSVSDGSGPLVPDAFAGAYSVQSSCEFTMNYSGNTWAGMLSDNGQAANLMVSVPNPPVPPADPAPLGQVVAGRLIKQ